MSGHGWQRASENLARKIVRAEGGGYVPIKATYYQLHTTSGGNSGVVAVPFGFTIAVDSWPDGVDALVVTVDGNDLPTYQQATTALGVPITTTLDVNGDYTFSATPSDATVAVVYMARGFFKFFDESKSVEQFIFELPPLYNHIAFDTTPISVPDSQGVESWSEEDRTLQANLGNGVFYTYGSEVFIDVENKTGATILNGTSVMFGSTVGASGNILAELSVTDGTFPADYMLGIATEDIANNASDGKVTWIGKTRGVDTTAWSKDDILFPDPTVPGGLTNVEPEAPNLKVPLAVVLSSSPNGQLLVRPNLKARLQELHDVQMSGITDGQVLGYVAARARWENRTATVSSVISLDIYEERPSRDTELNIHGALFPISTANALSTGVPINNTIGLSKIFIVPKAGVDFAGDITITGEKIDRNTGASTLAFVDTITIDALSVDTSGVDSGGNVKHNIVGGYMSSVWFRGAIVIATTDLDLSNVDVYQIAFEQFNDQTNIVIDSLDITFLVTNATADFNAHLYSVKKSAGQKFDIVPIADLEELTPTANTIERLRRGQIAISIDGTTDGVFLDAFFNGNAAYFENFNAKIWATIENAVVLGG